jgi:hypothetical protein
MNRRFFCTWLHISLFLYVIKTRGNNHLMLCHIHIYFWLTCYGLLGKCRIADRNPIWFDLYQNLFDFHHRKSKGFLAEVWFKFLKKHNADNSLEKIVAWFNHMNQTITEGYIFKDIVQWSKNIFKDLSTGIQFFYRNLLNQRSRNLDHLIHC